MIDTIMIFAAGLGTRMKPLTTKQPKPLIPILGEPIIYYALELALTYPFKRIVINTYYFPQQLKQFIEKFKSNHKNLPEIIIVPETKLLETGGAIKNAIHLLGNQPIFTLNSDVIIQTGENVFNHMLSKWIPSKMDFLLLLQDFENSIGYRGVGDFNLLTDGKIHKKELTAKNYPYIYAGLSLLKPNLVGLNPLQIFSLKEYYLSGHNTYGTVISGSKWYHATTPENLPIIESHLLKLNIREQE